MGRWEFLDGIAVADCAFDVEGESLADLFATAARVLTEVMVDPATVRPSGERTLTLTAPTLDLLLYDWLSELLVLKDSERIVVTRAEVEVADGPPCRLTASLSTGPIDPATTARRADAKAITFHQFALEPRGEGWRARVVVDI